MEQAKKPFNPFISIRPNGGMIEIFYELDVLHKTRKDGKLSCYIPAFEVYFSVNSLDEFDAKCKAFCDMYIDHFAIHSKGGVKSFMLQLHKLGFTANDNFAYLIHRLSKRDLKPTKFKIDANKDVPMEFLDAEYSTQTSKTSVAI